MLRAVPRYRFGNFIVSPRRRLLVRDGLELPLIPRYFDLLVFLIERRHEALHRRDIFDRVWNDVIVSDSALSQAIRTIRRTLGDDSREPRFIRTVSRRGYRFVFADVVEEEDDAAWVAPNASSRALPETRATAPDAFEPLLERVTRVAHGANEEEEQREAAELLHALGTSEALRRTIVDINGLPQSTESSVCDPPAPTIWEGARLDRAPDWTVPIGEY